MRFYRAVLIEGNTSPTNPTVSISYPTNGATLSDVVTVQVSANSPEILSDVRLYIDGEQQWPSDNGTNFVINTCEWLNGSHTLFATAKSQSGLEGIANGGVITYGNSVSSYVNVTFNNLISEIGFSQPYFEPALGQTQNVSALFAVNCNWTLQIQDAGSNTVRNASGSGTSLSFNWDGTGDGGTNIPDGIYHYLITATTNGMSPMSMPASPSPASTKKQLWVLEPDGFVPLAIFPKGVDTNGFTIVKATASQIEDLTEEASPETASSGTSTITPSFTTLALPSTQPSVAPTRKPTAPVKGTAGTFGICYKTYTTNGFSSQHPTTGFPPPLPTRVAIDGQARTDITTDYRVREFKYMADEIEAEFKRNAWKKSFILADNSWGATDIKKTSLGGNSIFNTVNFGILMTHGSYGNTGSTGTEDDNIRYTYSWLGPNNYVRLSDMDFGSSGTNGLRWMTIFACNIMKSANYTSMNNAGKIPVNDNLHLLQGFSTTSYAFQGMGYDYVRNMTKNNQSIVDAFNAAVREEATINSINVPITLKNAVSYWPNCLGDKLTSYSDPDPLDGLNYQETQVFP